jgi:glycosyltransferase involved in cell wall biosynthesis
VKRINAVSVIIPAYNAALTITESIKSVLSAAPEVDDLDVEVIVVDDGSADGTAFVVGSIFEHEQRVLVARHRRNRGGAAARNTAVELARHDWLFCLDADNLIDAKSFSRLVEMASTGDWDVVAPAETRFFVTSPSAPTHSWFWDRERLNISDVLKMYETPVASGNYLFDVDAWARAGAYPDFAGSLDAWGFGVRLLFTGARFGVCGDTFYLHRQGHESYYVRDTNDRRAIAAAQILLPYIDRLSESDQRRLLRDGELLRFFSELPEQPLQLANEKPRPPAHRVERIASRALERPSAAGRVGAALRRAWAEAPPQATARRIAHAIEHLRPERPS